MSKIHSPDDPAGEQNLDQQAGYNERECPMCGATCKKLPAHLRNNCEVTDG